MLRGLMFELFVRPVASVEGASVSLNDGEELPIAGGLKAIQCVWPLGWPPCVRSGEIRSMLVTRRTSERVESGAGVDWRRCGQSSHPLPNLGWAAGTAYGSKC